MNRDNVAHFAGLATTFVAAMVLDLAGKLSPQAQQLTLATLGAFGLSAAVTAFGERKGVAPAIEQALVELIAREAPSFLHNASEQLTRARVELGKFLALHSPLVPPTEVTTPETPKAKAS